MKTKKLWYGLLVGVASMLIAYACQNDVAPVEKAGQEAGTALVDKAKAYFESAIRQQVYTRGVADVYEESQETESGFIPSDYTPMWSRSFVAEEGNWKQVAAPVATFDKSYICTPDGEVDELAQAVVYREEAGETSCRMLVLWATDGRDAQTAVESFVGNAGQSDFTGVAWYLSLNGQVEKIEAYENGQLLLDSQAESGVDELASSYLEDVVVIKSQSNEAIIGEGVCEHIPWDGGAKQCPLCNPNDHELGVSICLGCDKPQHLCECPSSAFEDDDDDSKPLAYCSRCGGILDDDGNCPVCDPPGLTYCTVCGKRLYGERCIYCGH